MADLEAKADASASHLNWPTRIVMLSGGLMIMIAMSALTPVLPQIEAALADTAGEALIVKMLVPASGAMMVIGAPLTGFLVDRLGLRRILAIQGLIYAIAGTAGLYLTGVEALLVSRLLVGFSAAGMATISMTLINTRLEGNTRAKWMGFHIATAMLGALIVHPAVGALGEIGWRWPFIAYAAGLLLTVAAVSGLQETERTPDEGETGTAGAAVKNPLKWFPLWYLPFALVMGGVTYLPAVYLAYVVGEVGVSSPAVVSMVMLADAMIGAAMALLFGRSQRFISSNGAFIFAFSCTGTGMLIVSLSTSFTGVVTGMLVFGFGIGWFVPNLMTSLSKRVAQSQQGQAVGIIKSAHFLASPLAVLAVEPIARTAGPSGVMMASAVASFVVVGSFLYLSLRGRSKGSGSAGSALATK